MMAVVWEQLAPANSQSLDESLDNLHHWTLGVPLSPTPVPVLATQNGLTVASQVEPGPASLPPMIGFVFKLRCLHPFADLRLLGYAPSGSCLFVFTPPHTT